MTENGTSSLFPEIQFLNIPLEIKWLSCQHAFGMEIAKRTVGISKQHHPHWMRQVW
jgi:hypothetical protein